MRKICVVTGTRAEYGLLLPILRRINSSLRLELSLIVTGMHLLKEMGNTIEDIKNDGFIITSTVPMYGERTNADYTIGFGRGVMGITEALLAIKPEVLLVLGDRFEPLAATIAAASLNIPVAHIHGGDVTSSGHIDESIRHAITKFAHIHFPATPLSAKRIKLMGEEEWRIFQVGAPGLDTILAQKLLDRELLCQKLGLDPSKQIIVCIQHSVILEQDQAGLQMTETMEAIKELGLQTVVIYPNADPGSKLIIETINKYSNMANVKAFTNLPHQLYLSLLKNSSLLIGNSSSGIIEAPSFKLPVVNIGSRNKGREHADNVLFVENNKEDIISVVKKGLYDQEFRSIVNKCVNPYGDGKSSERIVNILESIEINPELLKKQLTY